MFEYDQSAALDIQEVSREPRGSVTVEDISFAVPGSERRVGAYLVTPPGPGSFAGTLYVHWYEPPNPTSNRTQFLEEAVRMAEQGVVSLLVDTMWSPHEWYVQRDLADDYEASTHQVIELRRALDVLLAQPGVDPGRVALVGHDFGGMFGAIVAGWDDRVQSYNIIAATPRFKEWYLFGAKLEGEELDAYVRRISELDPVTHIARAKNSAFFFQFGRTDRFVPEDKALELYEAAPGPKQIAWYDTDHEIEAPQAQEDRAAWLSERLRLQVAV
jgi:cephalosporin-C deacetylase-like acetyl esterase